MWWSAFPIDCHRRNGPLLSDTGDGFHFSCYSLPIPKHLTTVICSCSWARCTASENSRRGGTVREEVYQKASTIVDLPSWPKGSEMAGRLSASFHKYDDVCRRVLRGEVKERGGGDAGTSAATSDAEIARNPHQPEGWQRHAIDFFVAPPRSLTSPRRTLLQTSSHL